jgi:hypothetical protein
MGQSSMKVSGDKEFIASDRWKCDKSPSEAHYWIIHSYHMTCKYCNFSKPVNTERFGWTKPEEK